MKPVISTLVLAFGLGTAATTGAAQDVCMPAAELKASLIDWYGETPVDGATQDRQQLWASQRSGTWTMVRTMADGNACVVAQGENWMAGMNDREMFASLAD